MKLNIRTNNHWRDFVRGYELTAKERAEWDMLDDDSLEDRTFIRYEGRVHLDEFLPIVPYLGNENESGFDTWDGYMSDSFFSGLVIRYSTDCEQYQVGTYTC
jgi:hypothetical protein